MSTRRPGLASLAAAALALVVGAGLAAPAGATESDPFDEVRERVLGGVSAGSTAGGASSTAGGAGLTTGGAGSTTGGAPSTAAGSRIGHVVDAIDDVEVFDAGEGRDAIPSRYLRTVDINRFGYHFGQRTAKFTIRTRDLRSVKGAHTTLVVGVVTRSRGGTEEFAVFISGTRSYVEREDGWQRPCPGRSVVRDEARNTVTLRVPMRCFSGEFKPTSMQPLAASMLEGDDYFAMDFTRLARRADVRS